MSITGRLSIVASCTFCIALAQTAQADFTGLQTVERTDLPICQDQTEPNIPYKLDVCNVYAVFSDPADRLMNVGFSDGSTTDANGFFQHTFGSDLSPGCNLIPAFPALVCDSYITVGRDCSDGADNSATDPDWNSPLFNTAGQFAGGWYNLDPANDQGAPDANGKVLIAQFSVKQNKNTTGTLTIYAQIAGSDDIVEYALQAFDCSDESAGGDGSGAPTAETQGAGSDGSNPSCDGATGSCREVNGTPGCDCPECCDTVCALEPSCCDVSWTQACVDIACDECDLEACGECADATGSCYEAHGTPGCDCQECCNAVCCLDPLCCSGVWDSICAGAANDPNTGCPPPCSGATQQILYVDGDNQDPTPDGFSWATAFTDLQDALDLASCCDSSVEQVWVAKATNPYLPDRGTADRNETFQMTSGVQILGGFPPGGGDLADRLPDTHVTVLSGDLAGNDGPNPFENNGENSYHIVTAKRTDETGVLDGFTVTAGNDDSGGGPFDPPTGAGGGVLIADSSPTLINCTITANTAATNGGGILIAGGSPSLTDCDLTGNVAGSGGGALYLSAGAEPGSVELYNCTATSNQASGSGGGLYLAGSSATITGCTINSNTSIGSYTKGGGVVVSAGIVKFDNCTISGNDAPSGGGGLYFTGSTEVELVGDCVVDDNTTGGDGGGILINNVSSALLDGCSLSGNSSTISVGGGGAIYVGGAGIRLEDCTLLGNSSNADGGGLYVSTSASSMVVGCRFEGNSSGAMGVGGGAILNNGDTTIVNCIFDGNTATNGGGAIYNQKANTVMVVNGLFFGNTAFSHGGALYNDEQNLATLVNCTFHGNESVSGQGGAIYNKLASADLQCHNTLLWANIASGTSTETDQIAVPVGSYTVTYTTIMGLTDPGPFADGTNIGDNPSFVDVPNDDYHLLAGSPAIDHGDNNQVPSDFADLDNDGDTVERTPFDLHPRLRFMDDPASPNLGVADLPDYPFMVDMGAYEFPEDCGTCPWDLGPSEPQPNGNVGPEDLGYLLGCWGQLAPGGGCECLDVGPPEPNGSIGPEDLGELLGAWGPCP